MNSKSQVSGLVSAWIASGMAKPDIVVNTAKACMDWSYVWGAVGSDCTPDRRRYYMGRSQIGAQDRENIKKACQVLNGSASSCNGCKWYPHNQLTLCNDCQGFVKNVFSRVGITLNGGGCTSMWGDNSNWSTKGKLSEMPKDKVCLIFKAEGEKMSHVGIYCGNGKVIHCSHFVKETPCPDKSWGWSHYAMPAGLYGDAPITMPTLRKGSKGEYVTLMQTKLIQQGYSLEPYGADGSFGNTTLKALKQFQADHGLAQDGVCGKNSWNALLSGETTYYTVTIKHVAKSVADNIVKTYGGTMTKEG